MEPAAYGLIGAGIGAAAALLGQILAPLLQSKRSHQHWVRDKRAVLLEDYAATLSEAEADAWLMLMGVRHVPAERGLKYFNDISERLFRSGAKAELYTSAEVAQATRAATVAFMDLATNAQAPDDSPQTIEIIRESANKFLPTVEPVQAAIRRELDVQN